MMKLAFLLPLLIFLISVYGQPTLSPSGTPSLSPTKPTAAPTSKPTGPTRSPTRKPTAKPVAAVPNIYVKNEMITLTQDEQQGLVGALTILLFILMATEITGPEVLFLIALMIVTLAQILTLTEALSGMSLRSYNCE